MSIFSKIPIKRPKRNVFNLSHDVKLTTEFGRLTPFICEPVVPGDRWRVSTSIVVRMAPLTAPVMQRFKVYQHFYYVPFRLLWSKWNRFIFGAEKYDKRTGQPNTPDPSYPRFKFPEDESGIGKLSGARSLFDYLGFPADTRLSSGLQPTNHYFDVLPFRAYQLIWNEFFRDQNLQDEIDIGKDIDGYIDANNFSGLTTLLQLRDVGWRKDYFTSALPFAQRGPDVRLPITGDGDISYTDDGLTTLRNYNLTTEHGGGVVPVSSDAFVRQMGNDTQRGLLQGSTTTADAFNVDNSENLKVDLEDGVRSATINEVRRAFAVQKVFELAARVGSRPVEQLLGFFGVRSSDARLQRPEYIGGNVSDIYIGEVLQTSESNEDGTPLATPAGVGSASSTSRQFTRFFEEHGYVIGLMFVVPMASYFQGLPRKYTKFERFDHYFPQFANLGEQEIKNQELFFDPYDLDASNESEFGYTPRYAEYKFINDSVHGDFRTSLDFWHDARKFSSRPALNGDFITVKPKLQGGDINRIFAVTETEFEDHLWCHIYNNIEAIRPMPKFGIPSL